MTNTPEFSILAERLGVGYGRQIVVDNIEFTTSPGALVVLIGTNGSGKSTLLKTLAGMITPVSGRVTVLGSEPGKSPRRVAYLPQHPVSSHTLPLRARDVVAMGRFAHLGLFGRESAIDREILQSSLERTGAIEFADKPLRDLSGGQQQRTHLAQVLTRRAEILLLDEPTAGLDITGRQATAKIIAQERGHGVTVVLATHELSEAKDADLVILLAQRVVAVGTPDAALRDEYLRECFGFTQPH
ncbi:MAG: metal ABC transporter ATP-binding protein [Acidimicrobiaceae bacterium]|nr:metal ABC transporter ATP-binding protein [Acidimicrobiaceae bacterium]